MVFNTLFSFAITFVLHRGCGWRNDDDAEATQTAALPNKWIIPQRQHCLSPVVLIHARFRGALSQCYISTTTLSKHSTTTDRARNFAMFACVSPSSPSPPWCLRSYVNLVSNVPSRVPPTATPASFSSHASPGGRGKGAVSRGWPARSTERRGSCPAPSFRATPTGASLLKRHELHSVLEARVCVLPRV